MRVAGVDIGTTSIGYAVRDTIVEQPIAVHSFAHHAALPAPHDTCQDVARLYRGVVGCIENITKEWKGVTAITITGQMHGILYIDRDGNACSPLYTWLYDGAAPYRAEIAAKSGYTIPAGYGIATHYANMQENRVPKGACGFCTIMDYVVMKLRGERVAITDPTCAASLGLYHTQTQKFDYPAAEKLGIAPRWLPQLTASASLVGKMNGTVGITAPIGDNQASYIGTALSLREQKHRDAVRGVASHAAVIRNGAALLNIGTGAQIAQPTATYKESTNRAIEWRPLLGDTYLMVGSTLSGGKALEVCAQYYIDIYRQYGTEPMDKARIYDGITRFQRANPDFTPHEPLSIDTRFSGSRNDPAARGSIGGIGLRNLGFGEVLYGIMDGIVSELHALWHQCHLPPPRALIGSGNALRNNPFLQRLAALRWETPLHLTQVREESAIGATYIAEMAMSNE